ncbi:MAG: 30S ribosome-binding factor RbfA [Planctomycetota bacterium]|nr:MAG: 30S ribosome-binding factor RbfA [Planctomycetota bacterium]
MRSAPYARRPQGDEHRVSRRTERIASVVRHVVARAMQTRLNDPRLERFTSVTRVEVSDDLSIAHVYVSVMAPTAARKRLSVDALSAAAPRLRRMLGDQLHTRVIPQIAFHLDESLQRGFETVQLIDGLMQRGEPDGGPDADEAGAAAAGEPEDGCAAPPREDT